MRHKCKKCNEWKIEERFVRNIKTKTGLSEWCGDCLHKRAVYKIKRRGYQKEYYLKNKKKMLKKNNKWNNENTVYRKIAKDILGRDLKHGEVVHHINGDHEDNRHCNLLICDYKYHVELHRKMRENKDLPELNTKR